MTGGLVEFVKTTKRSQQGLQMSGWSRAKRHTKLGVRDVTGPVVIAVMSGVDCVDAKEAIAPKRNTEDRILRSGVFGDKVESLDTNDW